MSHPKAGQDREEERTLAIPAAELQALRRAIAEAAGPGHANEILFRLGQRLGEKEATALARRRHDGHDAIRAAMTRGLARLAELGMGKASLEVFDFDAEHGHCRVRGHVVDTAQLRAGDSDRKAEGAICELTVGYLTGLTGSLTGLDVVCSPFRCAERCETCGCAFEIGPAHREAGSAQGAPAPSGSARFFLRTMGKTLADADISLDELVENSSDAIILIDSQDVIRFWNRGAERMFDHGREEAVGRKVGFLLPPDLREANELGLLQARINRDGSVRNYVTRRAKKNGQELWVSLSRAVLHDSQGAVVGSTATIRDITDQRTTEAELYRARSLALLGEMAAKVAHEIKNPLAGIYAAVQLLGRDFQPMDPRRTILDSVGAEIRRLDETVQELLRFARPAPARLRPESLPVFLHEWLEALQRHPDMQRHVTETAIPEDLSATFDGRLLGQALTNLILNAAQAMEHPGTIGLAARAAGTTIVIEVWDTGPGIRDAELAKIFEPFYTTRIMGTGLGLPIARQNVEAHGGRLEVENRACGGALFRIVLPQPRDPGGGPR